MAKSEEELAKIAPVKSIDSKAPTAGLFGKDQSARFSKATQKTESDAQAVCPGEDILRWKK